MANTLLPIEEQNLTPNQVEQLDKRRTRGFMLMVIAGQFGDYRHCAAAVDRPGSDLRAGMGASCLLLFRHCAGHLGHLRA